MQLPGMDDLEVTSYLHHHQYHRLSLVKTSPLAIANELGLDIENARISTTSKPTTSISIRNFHESGVDLRLMYAYLDRTW